MMRKLTIVVAGVVVLAVLGGAVLAAETAGPPAGVAAPGAVGAMPGAGQPRPGALAMQMLMGRGYLTPNEQSQALWKQLLDQFITLQNERWVLFGLMGATPRDQGKVKAQEKVILALMKQMGETGTALQPYWHAQGGRVRGRGAGGAGAAGAAGGAGGAVPPPAAAMPAMPAM
jgi:hypothetical protein